MNTYLKDKIQLDPKVLFKQMYLIFFAKMIANFDV